MDYLLLFQTNVTQLETYTLEMPEAPTLTIQATDSKEPMGGWEEFQALLVIHNQLGSEEI